MLTCTAVCGVVSLIRLNRTSAAFITPTRSYKCVLVLSALNLFSTGINCSNAVARRLEPISLARATHFSESGEAGTQKHKIISRRSSSSSVYPSADLSRNVLDRPLTADVSTLHLDLSRADESHTRKLIDRRDVFANGQDDVLLAQQQQQGARLSALKKTQHHRLQRLCRKYSPPSPTVI